MPVLSNEPGSAQPEQLAALVVLGCRVIDQRPSTALERRLRIALVAQAHWPSLPLVLCGGKRWEGVTEAEVMARWLGSRGVTQSRILLEERSVTTAENAMEAASLLHGRGLRDVGLVTCDFHIHRATDLFEHAGFSVFPLPAASELGFFQATRMTLREWGARGLHSLEELVS